MAPSALPTVGTIRRVVRYITYEGDPKWIEETLARSLKEGIHPFHTRSSITVLQVADTTSVVYARPSRAELAPQARQGVDTLTGPLAEGED